MQQQHTFDRVTVVRNTALILACIILLATLLRVLIAEAVATPALVLGVLCAVALLLVYRYVGDSVSESTGAVAVMFVAMFIYAVLSYTSHGFRGSLIFVAPLMPLLASLMMGRRAVRNVTMITACFLLFVIFQHLAGNIHVDERYPEENRYSMRAIIMLFSLVAATWIANFFVLSAQATTTPVAEPRRDSLTGLLDAECIREVIEREMARARRSQSWFSLAIAEIDSRAQIESEHGSQALDNCLLGVADALRFSMKRSSDALGRYSADRLCIVMSATDSRGAERVAEKFRKLVEDLDIPLDSTRTTRLTISVAVASVQGLALVSPVELMAEAEGILDEGLAAGGNRVVVRNLTGDVSSP